MRNLGICLSFGFLSLVFAIWNEELAERRLEQEKDQSVHDCRACKAIETDIENCPTTGFDCAVSQVLKTNVLSPNDCPCAQIKCADTTAMLMVDGILANKVICKNNTWQTPAGEIADTAVCARRCGVCPDPLLNAGFEEDGRLEAFTLSTPDAEHPCAWGQCTKGAFGSTAAVGPNIHRDNVWFTCSAGVWNMRNPDGSHTEVSYDHLQCIKKRCEDLPYDTPSVCGTKHSCVVPQLVPSTEPNEENKMVCDKPTQLRSFVDVTKIMAPTCFLGQWQDNGQVIGDDTKVVCINCPAFTTGPNSLTPPPEWNTDSNQIVCTNGKLHVSVEICLPAPIGCKWIPPIRTTSIFCDTDFTWDSTGGVLNSFASIKDVVNNNKKWRVICKN